MMSPHTRRILDGEILEDLVFPPLPRTTQEPVGVRTNTTVLVVSDQPPSFATQDLPRRYRARVLAEPYHAVESYGGFTLRYVIDPEHEGCVRVYVEDHPSYNGLDCSPHVAHLWPARGGAPAYICFKGDHMPRTYEQARRLAEFWCDLTGNYIQSGETISAQIARRGS